MTKITIPHKHQTLINIWAADPTIEFDYRADTVEDWGQCGAQPMWRPHHFYRVRPKPQVAKYRMAYSERSGAEGISYSHYLNADDFRKTNHGCEYRWVQSLTETKEMFDE